MINSRPGTDRAFIGAFESGGIAAADFHHADHLRLALAYLADSASIDEATARMAAGLRAFARNAGKEEKYHHTLTVVWVRLVARLLDKQLPLAYYSPERLFSADARSRWVEPDRQPLGVDDSPRRLEDLRDPAAARLVVHAPHTQPAVGSIDVAVDSEWNAREHETAVMADAAHEVTGDLDERRRLQVGEHERK